MSESSDTSTPVMDQSRRQFLRVPLIVQRVRMEEDRQTFFGYAKNISRGGMFIAATEPREIGSRFKVAIPLPRPLDRTVHCDCEVIWRRPWSKDVDHEPGMGLRFIDLPDDDGDAIDAWIDDATKRDKQGLVPLS